MANGDEDNSEGRKAYNPLRPNAALKVDGKFDLPDFLTRRDGGRPVFRPRPQRRAGGGAGQLERAERHGNPAGIPHR